jgi:hypothetical protein
MTALITPFRADGKVDDVALRSLIERQLDAGITGLIPCGTTGETPTLNHDEIATVISITVETVRGRVPVIAGTGSNSTQKTIESTRLARELGADAALVVTPYYNKPGPKMLEAHYRAVAADGGLPVVLYNVPGRTGINMTAETTLALTQVALRGMITRKRGTVVFISSIAGRVPLPFLMPYSMTKFALSAAAAGLRAEMDQLGKGISVCVVEPGAIHTGFNQSMTASKYAWMGPDSYFHDQKEKMQAEEKRTFSFLEAKTTDSVVAAIVQASEAKRPRLRYVAPWIQGFGVRLARIFGV